jgi:hypothetical protein
MPQDGGVHHIGYWGPQPPHRGEPARRARLPSYATAGTTPLLNRGPSGTLIELCDLHSDRPSLPDLFPPESEFAGDPLPGSAL